MKIIPTIVGVKFNKGLGLPVSSWGAKGYQV
jgi:hypothetical protein